MCFLSLQGRHRRRFGALTVVVRLISVVWENDAVGVGISTSVFAEDLANSILRTF
jgi:hypothetical protein